MQELKTYIVQLLNSNGVEKVRVLGDNIHAKCPFHKPKHNDTAFSVNWKKDICRAPAKYKVNLY